MQIRFYNREGWRENKFHTHDHLNILFMLSEGGHFYVRDKIYPITYGSLFILNPEDLHRNVPCTGSFQQYYSILFYPEEMDGFINKDFDILSCFRNHEKFNYHAKLRSDQVEHLLKIINKLEHYLNKDCSAYGKSVYIKTLLAEILVFINFLYEVPSASCIPENEAFCKLQPVFIYIQEHLSDELTLDILSRQIFISKYHLSHLAKGVLGYPLSEYIIRQRVHYAKSLLRQGYSVSITAERSGFNSSTHFIRMFNKYVGISPKQYAKKYLSLEEYDSSVSVHWDVSSFSQQDMGGSVV